MVPKPPGITVKCFRNYLKLLYLVYCSVVNYLLSYFAVVYKFSCSDEPAASDDSAGDATVDVVNAAYDTPFSQEYAH